MITTGRPASANRKDVHQPTVTFASSRSKNDQFNSSPPPLPRPQKEHIPTPNREERRVQFGIDCAELVHFTHWEPGREHVKQLVVKNVVMKTQKIRYKLPQTRYFSMEFPETMTLSAGMNWTVSITFRPVAKENYHDVIEFTTSFGKFHLPIKATLPEHVLDFPKAIDFELCPIREIASQVFLLKNVGELPSYYEWVIPKPFAITPRTGSLAPGENTSVTIDFKPNNASVFSAIAVCNFGNRKQWERSKVAAAMHVHGIGKYSFLAIESGTKVFDFGDVFIGKSIEKKFVLWNHSAVNANFKIQQPEDTDPYFEFSTLTGAVPSGKSITITITYTPVAAGLQSIEYYDITTLSGNTIRITCSGCGVGPIVTLNTNVVNFNDVVAGTTATRALYLQNHSSTSAFYQFLTEPNSIFRIDKPYGTIQPHSSVALTIKFTAFEPINYYRRVYCLVEHHDGLILDILGTCYNDKRRPATFLHKHIEKYQMRKRNGLWSFGPEQLEEMMKNGRVKCEQGVLSWIDSVQADAHMPRTIADSSYSDCQVASEYFYENVGDCEPVSLVDTYIDFGSCSRYRVIDSQCIRIANNTKGKMSCVWIMPGETSGQEPVFTVTPVVTDILPKSTVDFRVNFRPTMDNQIYGAQLECFVYFKSMRNFRLVNEETFTPPWCLTPLVTGNTFAPGQDTFIPKIDLGGTRLDFPSCHVDKSVYRTVRVSNTGDTPVHFAIIDGGLKEIGGGTAMASAGGAAFTVKPRVGLLRKDESRLLVFRFSPSEQRIYEQALKCAFNSSAANSYDLHMRGVGYYPYLSFDTHNTVCFKPTCIGAVAKRTFPARNRSRISVNYEWRIPQQYSSIISIEPLSGKVPPNGSVDLVCTFAPNATRNWLIKLPCYYSHEARDDNSNHDPVRYPDLSQRRSTLSVMGKGAHGRIVAQPANVDLNAVLVNSLADREIVLYNPTECDVFYQIVITRRKRGTEVAEDLNGNNTIDGPGDSADEEGETIIVNNVKQSGLEILQRSNVLPARSHQALRVRVCLREQVKHHFRIYYRLETQALHSTQIAGSFLAPTSKDGKHHLCDISALGVHPLIQITDIRSEGLSKSLLWKLFSVEHFNSRLTAVDLLAGRTSSAANDSATAAPSSFSPHEQSESSISSAVDLNFSAAPVGCSPTIYHLNLRNSGVVPVEWVFYFPNDLEIEMEHWADPGNYTEEQMHHNLIIENSLFTVQPKSGWLEPDETVHVVMAYSHEYAGYHKLPITFQLRNGSTQSSKDVELNFVGYSIPPTKKCLHFHEMAHRFDRVEISTMSPPVQTYQLMNRGAVSLDFTLDLTPLEELKAENYEVDIFQCRRSSGTIAPGQIVDIDWVFRPLEVKEYQVDIPITFGDGKTQIISFRGQGMQREVYLSPDDRLDPRDYHDPIPPTQELDVPRQMVKLSRERVNFGHVPLTATVRDLVIITNTDIEHDASFKWSIPASLTDALKITPQTGILSPGSSRVCKLSFTPGSEPRIYQTDVTCEIIDETDLAAFNEAKDMIETARREGRPLSVIEPILRKDSVVSQPDLAKAKYRTLPPITPPKTPAGVPGDRGADGDSTKERRPSSALSVGSDANSFIGLPPAPEPFYVFLALVARSHPVDEFRSTYSGYEHYYHERRSADDIADLASPIFASSSIRAVLTTTISSLLHDVFQDQDIQDLPEKLRQEPVPYYAQLVTGRPINGIVSVETLSASQSSESVEKDQVVDIPINPVLEEQISRREQEAAEVILGSPEFQNLVETVLDGTLGNLLQEANLDEWDLTKHRIALYI